MSDEHTTPEVADRHRRYLVLAMLAVAVMSGANAVERIVGPETARLMEHLELAMVIVVAMTLLPMMAWKFKNRDQSLQYLYLDETGYVAQTLHRAKNASWVATFVFLSVLAPLARRFEAVPSEFFVYLSTAVMLAVFVVTFFILNFGGSNESEEDERASSRA